MRVLVTGGSGYVGGPTVRRLTQDGTAVVVVDRVEPPSVLVPSIERSCEGDIRTPGLLDRVFAGADIDAVIHLAADKSVEESVRDPGSYFNNNVGGTLALVEAMERAGVGSIIFSSTCAVYGTPETVPVTEASRIGPESPYGASKLMAEAIIDWYGQLQRVSLRIAALLQRGRCVARGRSRRGLDGRPDARTSGDEGRARAVRPAHHLRDRLPDTRWDGDPGLHPRT